MKRYTVLTHVAQAVTLIALVAAGTAAADTPRHARVSYEDGGVLIRGQQDDEWSIAPTNTLVLEGDVVWTDAGARAELEFPGANFMRLDEGSRIEVQNLSYQSTLYADAGRFYLHRLNHARGSLSVETPAGSVLLNEDCQALVTVSSDGAVTVAVRQGRADVSSWTGGATTVVAGRRTHLEPGFTPSAPSRFDLARLDSFDRWAVGRAEYVADGLRLASKAPLVSVDVIGAGDLANHGQWLTVDSSIYWRPRVSAYVPYRKGHWSVVVDTGPVWVGHHPFEYVTSHYGRWTHHARHGWLWSYDPVWSPAWVTVVEYNSRVIWTPVDYYTRPVLVHGSVNFSIGGVDFSIGASSYATVDTFASGPVYVAPVRRDLVRIVPASTVTVWDVGAIRRSGRNPFAGRLEVRDYSPRRSIRGPSTMGRKEQTATARVSTMEQSGRRAARSTRPVTAARSVRADAVDQRIARKSTPDRPRTTRTAVPSRTPVPRERDAVRRTRPDAAKRTPVPSAAPSRRVTESASSSRPDRGGPHTRPDVAPAPSAPRRTVTPPQTRSSSGATRSRSVATPTKRIERPETPASRSRAERSTPTAERRSSTVSSRPERSVREHRPAPARPDVSKSTIPGRGSVSRPSRGPSTPSAASRSHTRPSASSASRSSRPSTRSARR